MLQGCIAKAKKLPKLSSETKADIEAFEGKLAATAAEKQEEQATAEAARKQVAAPEEMDASDGEMLISRGVHTSPFPPPPTTTTTTALIQPDQRQCHWLHK